jgi:arylsulfatase
MRHVRPTKQTKVFLVLFFKKELLPCFLWEINMAGSRALLTGVACISFCLLRVATAQDLPKPPPPFTGRIDPSRQKSVPAWPGEVTAPAGAPNIVLILLDDVGFGATTANGGVIPTPALDQLAREGIRYNNFHVNALCSPTRGALLTGRNNHQLGFAAVTDFAVGYPGYNSVWPKSAASIAEVLKDNGYSTAAFGKWHNTPFWEVNPAGPFDHWPTGEGFEYFYGFMGGSTSQWEPALYRNTIAVEPPKTPEQGYILNEDLANDAIHWLHQHDAIVPEKPFFLYYATGGAHAPHQVPKQWIDRFHGKFDAGWDVLRERIYEQEKARGIIPANADLVPRPREIPAWDTLSADTKKLMARQMEVYAAFLAETDHEVGRVLQAIRDEGKGNNTLVLYIVGDNGAEEAAGLIGGDLARGDGLYDAVAEQLKRADALGSKTLNNNYAAGWASALNAPFPWSKQVASHLGGITDPLFVVWPSHISDPGGLRTQFSHITDVAPTIYQAVGITPPDKVNGVAQMPLEGKSLLQTFTDPRAQTGHTRQYFEMLGNRGIYDDGWFAGKRFLLPWESGRLQKWTNEDPDTLHPWELYNLNEDYSQAHNLASRDPAKLAELVALYNSEAWRNNAYPTAPLRQPLKSPAMGKETFTYREGVVRLPLRSAPVLSGRSHVFTADVDIPASGAEGVIFAEGGRYGGFSLYVKDGKLSYENNAQGRAHEIIQSAEKLPAGRVRIVYEFAASGANDKSTTFGAGPRDGHGKLSVNGREVGERDISSFGAFPLGETFDVGRDLGSPVSNAYETPFPFTARIDKITLELR